MNNTKIIIYIHADFYILNKNNKTSMSLSIFDHVFL